MTALAVRPTALRAQRRLQGVRPGMIEAVNEDLYDSVSYAAAGTTTQYRFFAIPRGQSGKTSADTNMDLQGTLPQGITFEVRAIELHLFPGVLPALGQQNSAAAAGTAQFVNDIYTLSKAGFLQLDYLAKPYLIQAPIGRFPPSQRLYVEGFQSDTTSAGAAQLNRVAYATFGGAQFKLTPLKLDSSVNFGITLNFPTTTALPSGQPCQLFCVLRGIKYRTSQ